MTQGFNMITYLYWALVFALALLALFTLGLKLKQWKLSIIFFASVIIIGSLAYFFHFQQVFVKHWGGVMTLSIPD